MAIAGKNGSVSVDGGTSTVGDISEWSIDESADMLEETEFGDDHRAYIAGLKDTTGSFSGNFNGAEISGTTPGTQVSLKLEVNTGNYIEATALIETRSVSGAVDGLFEATYDFQVIATPTWTIA